MVGSSRKYFTAPAGPFTTLLGDGMTKEENNQNDVHEESSDSENESESAQPLSFEVESVPNEALEFRQSHWAWLMPSCLWIAILLVVIFFDFISMGLVPVLICFGIAGPRYLRWRQTAYYVSEDSLYLTMVGLPVIQKRRTFQIPFDSITELLPKHGYLGRTLSYAEVEVKFKDSRSAKLSYMDKYDEFMNHIQLRTKLDNNSGQKEHPYA